MPQSLELVRSFGKALHAATDNVTETPLPPRWVALIERLRKKELELNHLALAERRVREAEGRIARQRERIARLALEGRETVHSTTTLEVMLVTFEHMVSHRDCLRHKAAAGA